MNNVADTLTLSYYKPGVVSPCPKMSCDGFSSQSNLILKKYGPMNTGSEHVRLRGTQG